MPRTERRETTAAYPPVLSDEEILERYYAQVKPGQEIERNYIGRDECRINLTSNEPIILVCVSDLHIGSMATDYDAIREIFEFVMKTPNAKMMLLGDEIEGMSGKYMNTNTARVFGDTQKQKDVLAELLKPVVAQDKLAGMVANYWGHNGWEEDATTANPWMEMANRVGLSQDRVIRNGGRVIFRFPNGYEHSETIWHNPPGKSKIEAVYGLRNAAFGTSESSRTDGHMSGHIHKIGVSKELYSGGKMAVYYISSGTAKGSSEEIPPDRFGVKLGAPLTDPLGQGVVIEPRGKNREEMSYPFATLRQGKMINNALELLNWTEKKGMTAELLEKIRQDVEKKPRITLVESRSHVGGDEYAEDRPVNAVKIGREWIRNPYSKQEMRIPYDSLTYDVRTKLPVALHLMSNARLGSSSEGYDDMKRYHQEQIAYNPHSLVVFLRNMIDKDAGKSPHREEILDRFKEIINGAKEQTLAIMMCESLRSDDWRKKVKTGEEFYDAETGRTLTWEEVEENEELDKTDENKIKIKQRSAYSMPMAPASYLAAETDTPLIHHLSLIRLVIGPNGSSKNKPIYTGAFADKLMNHGSLSRPEFGLSRMYHYYTQEKPGFVAGGHMPHAGSMMFYDGSNAETNTPILVAPGWFAKYVDTMGSGNAMPGAEPGQAIIFMPGETKDDYLAFPTVNAAETGYMQDALTLLRGLEILGLTDSVLSRRRRRN